MKFSKIGKHTIRCVISEQEIQDLGNYEQWGADAGIYEPDF